MKVLITGSSGFLGSKICKILSDLNHEVTGIDVKSPNIKIKNVVYHNLKLLDFLSDNNDLNNFDLIIHTASILPYKSKEEELVETNLKSTEELINNISKSTRPFFIYISSSGIYGKPKDTPITNTTSFNPLDVYAKTKIVSEEYIKDNLDVKKYAIIRPRTILGETRGGIFDIFFKLIKYGIPLPLPNNGKQKLQFVDVEDVASFTVFLGINFISGVWPAAGPEPIQLKKHLNNLEKIINKKIYTININPTLFKIIGNILINLKITNFTKWHFGAFPYDNYFDESWRHQDFNYIYSSNDTFLRCAKGYFKY